MANLKNNSVRLCKHNLYYALFLVFLLFSLSNYGQDITEKTNIRIKYFTLEDGLSQVSNNDLLKDNSGFIWIATDDGLNRFDGKEFKHFKTIEKDTMTISGNQITKLLEDKTGKIWIGTSGNGLNYYNKDLDVFHRIKLEYSQYENENISDLTSDIEGNIWITSRVSGLHRLTPLNTSSFSQKNYFPDKALTALSKVNKNNLWVGDFNGHIYELDLSNNKSNHKQPICNIGGKILTIYPIDQYLFIGSELGFFLFDRMNKTLKLIELEKEGELNIVHVTSILKKDKSSFWIGTGSGLFLFDRIQMKVLRKIVYSENNTKGLSNNTVLSLLNLSNEQLLVGTANYLNLLDFTEPFFKNISKDKRGKHLLNDNVIFSILKDGEDLWIGTSDGGLNLLRDNKAYTFKGDQNNSNSISGDVIREIVKDQKNQILWLATSRGLSMINLKTFNVNKPVFTVFYYDREDSNTINMNFLKGIALDKNGNLWGATYGQGIFRLERNKQNIIKIIRYKNEKGNLNSLVNDITQCIRIDNQNNIWVGTQGGLTKISFKDKNYKDPVFTNYTHASNLSNSLSNNSVYDILIDKDDRIWVGTHKGLNLLKEESQFDSWIEQNQFPNAVVYSIQDDKVGNLWLGTNNGIVRFNTKNKSFYHYGVEDGIQSKEFDIHAKFRDKSGMIYLGGIAGVTHFQPSDIEKLDHPLPLYFSQLQVKNQLVNTINSSNNRLKRSIIKTQQLNFKYNQFPFYLRFSSIDYRMNKNVEFAYKLLPVDDKWNLLKDSEIQFLNLPSGDYTLQVNGFSRGIEWDQPPLEMNLHILPPWWATWWAYIIYLGIAIAFADRFYRFQLSKKLAIAESTRLIELDHLKNSLYTNITHEFRTPLTVILGMADSLKSKVTNNQLDHAKQSIEMIERNGKNLLQLVNEMLDLSKLESGKMELQLVQSNIIPFVKYLTESFHSLAQEKQINLTVYSEVDKLIMDFDAKKLTSIISNVLSNAIKFTSTNGKIIVHLKKIKNGAKAFLFIKIKDNGLGISKNEITNIFNRFYQANNTTSRKNDGTGIGMSLTKDFVELMKGTITVKSKQNIGSEFIILLPITNNARAANVVESETEPKLTMSLNNVEPTVKTNDDKSDLPLALIIEDNEDVAHYLKTCLQDKYQTIHAINGKIGINTAYEKMPDIIICDVMMPVKDGYETCAELKLDERTDHIPIIMLTAKVTMKDRITGLTSGADAYLTKPFVKAELFTRLDQLILLRKRMIQKFEKGNFNQLLTVKAENPETKFLQKIIKIIHEEISNHSFGSSIHLSQKMHLSESQIYRKLKAITGKSTAVFIRSIRLQYAKELILTTNKNVSEIAYETGFNDPSWFSRAFKEEFGVTPSAMYK